MNLSPHRTSTLAIILLVTITAFGSCYWLGRTDGRISAAETAHGAMKAADEAQDIAQDAVTEATSAEASLTAAQGRILALEQELATVQAQKRERHATTAPKKAAYTGGCEQWRSLVAAYFPPAAVDEALLCIWLESRGDPNAVNGQHVGLFQMTDGWGSEDQRRNPEYAVACAASSYRAVGWQHWPPMLSRGFR